MEPDKLREWLKRKPFQPFRVHVADGRKYDVRFPRMNLLAQTFIKIGIPAPELQALGITGVHFERGDEQEIVARLGDAADRRAEIGSAINRFHQR